MTPRQNSGPIESNRTLALINRVLHWAVDGGLIPYNPAARMKKTGKEKASERVLDDPGIWQFWTALDELTSWAPPKGMGAMHTYAVSSGCRNHRQRRVSSISERMVSG